MSSGSSIICQATQHLALAECWYWIRKLQARFFAGDYASAIEASSRAQRLLWIPSFFDGGYHFYGALSRRRILRSASAGERQQHLGALAAHHRQLQIWAENCPENSRTAPRWSAPRSPASKAVSSSRGPLRKGHSLGPRKRLCPQ